MAVVSEPSALIGRETELELIEAALDAVARDEAAVLALEGEPGIGKTRLLAELGARADDRRHLVLDGRAAEYERDFPFGIFLDALEDYLPTVNPRLLASLGPARLGELAAVFRGLPAGDDAPPPALSVERFRLHRAVGALLAALAQARPLVLLLDDLHWADAASRELAGHLVATARTAPVLLAVAFRTGQAGDPLAAALETAVRDGRGAHRLLSPLDADGCARLLADRVPASMVADLQRDSGGNPFYLEQLGRTAGWEDAEDAPTAGDTSGRVPARLAASVRRELDRAGSDAQRLLTGAAVVGDRFEIALAAVAAGLTPEEAGGLAARLLELDLVRPTDVPARLRFRHPIVRRAVYEAAGEELRAAAHRRVARALAEQGASEAARAHHVERCAEPGDLVAANLLATAADAVAPRAPATAAGWLEAALRLTPDDPAQTVKRVAMLAGLARAQASAGRLEESRVTLEALLASVPPEASQLRAQLVVFIAETDHLLGRHVEAEALVHRALDDLGPGPSDEAAQLKLQLASARFFAGDFGPARAWTVAALELAETHSEPVFRAAVTAHMAFAEYHLGRVPQTRAAIARARGMVDALVDAELAPHVYALLSLGFAQFGIEELAAAERSFARGLEVSREYGQNHLFPPFVLGLGWTARERGRLVEAREHAEVAIEAGRLSRNDRFVSWGLTHLAWVQLEQGEVPAALDAADRAIRLVAADDPNVLEAIASCVLGLARLEAGEPAAAREAIVAPCGGAGLSLLEAPLRGAWFEVLAQAELAEDRTDAAEEWVHRAERLAATVPLAGRTEGAAARARARLCLARGEPDVAVERARAAERGFAAAGMPVEAARSATLAGSALAASAETAAARECLQSAHQRLEQCGAVRDRDAAARELRHLGRRVPRRQVTPNGANLLSPREREVAALVSDGKTNREIGELLFVSEKTVETHVSHVLAKLGVAKRAAVGGRLVAG